MDGAGRLIGLTLDVSQASVDDLFHTVKFRAPQILHFFEAHIHVRAKFTRIRFRIRALVSPMRVFRSLNRDSG